jgi:hypothetical protein
MRRTRIQCEAAQRRVEEHLVEGVPPREIVQNLASELKLTPRQIRHDLKMVRQRWAVQDDLIHQGKWTDRELAAAADRREWQIRDALQNNELKRAAALEKDRSRLLGLYAADRKRSPYMPQAQRDETEKGLKEEFSAMYQAAPRNPDGSVVLTAYSRTRPPVDDPAYRKAIEDPLGRKISERRQERIDDLRSTLAQGLRLDELEAAARRQFKLSQRTARESSNR